MSTHAPARERAREPETPLVRAGPVPRPRPRLRAATALPMLFVLAAAYHALQSALHVTPAIFTDELLHSELARSLAAGEGFRVRGEPVFFPAFLPAVVQAPAWLAGDMGTAYALAKALNALVMSAAVFPAYWLGRQLLRPAHALAAAAAAVAAPALVYHSYLLSEALAYPVFLATVAVLVRALARPSAGWGAAALAASLVAVGTRAQFVALPLVFALVVATRWRELRRHAVPVVGLALLGVGAVAGGTAVLGTYAGLGLLEHDPAQAARWTALTALLLPFGAGWIFFPGAALGLARLATRPLRPAESAFARLTLGVAVAFLGQAGVIAAGESERPLERYVIYLAPLLVIACLAYLEHGLPWRRAYVALAAALALSAWVTPFPALADFRFSFDSPVLSAYGVLADGSGAANAATVFGAVPLFAAALLVLRPRAVRVLAGLGIALLLATGLLAYAGDHGMAQRARAAWAGVPADWLDRGGWGRADFLALPGGSPHFAWTLEAWNRDFGRPLWLGVRRPAHDPYAGAEAGIADDGTLLVDGTPAPAGLLVVNDFATQVGLEGETVAEPRDGLRLVRVGAAPRVAWLARGLFHDGWANGDFRYRAWPEEPSARGRYRIRLSLPAGAPARGVTLTVEGGERRTITLAGGEATDLTLPVRADGGATPELRVTASRAELLDGRTANPRFVAFRVDRVGYEPVRPEAPFTL